MKQIRYKVAKLADKKNKYIVFNPSTMEPASGIRGQSRSTAYRIAKRKNMIPRHRR